MTDSGPDPLARPVFVVAPPGSGQRLLGESMFASPGSWHAGDDGNALTDGTLRDGDHLTAADAAPVAGKIRSALLDRYAGLDMTGRPGDAIPRLYDASPRSALRVPFLDAIFSDAMFVYLHRSPEGAVSQELAASSTTAEAVAEQWLHTATLLLDDLEQLPPERWCVADYDAFLREPESEVQRVFRFLGFGWQPGCSVPMQQAAALRGRGVNQPPASEAPAAQMPRLRLVAERAAELIAPAQPSQAPSSPPGSLTATDDGLGDLLKKIRSSLLVSTYQSDRLITLRHDEGALGVHLRQFDRPMGIARHPSGFALGTRAEVLDYRAFQAAAANVEPKGKHDHLFVPRNSHYTADIAIHDLAYGDGELWVVATAFSCLATLDSEHSFVPRWTPPFITELAPEDRCHLNGLAIEDGKPRYVTALGVSDEKSGWRADKATGGVVIDVASGEVVVDGLSMPHSPRLHDGALWLLESGRGAVVACDLESGTRETVAEVPGFTRGLAFSGDTAFVGLSQIRETATFGGLPIAQLDRRECGVWAIDTNSGEPVGSVRFEDRIQEIFDLELLPGAQFPEVAEPGSETARSCWYLPPRQAAGS